MLQFNPPHPGSVLKELILAPENITITQIAALLDVSRKHLSHVVSGKAPISVALAISLERNFAPKAETWLNMQNAYDLWQARHKTTH